MGDEPTPLHALDPEAPACVHHWLLGDPVGNQIPGRCKRCGARRVYSNSIEGTDRFDDYREITASSEYYAQRASA
jgi:hypothetical protein